MFQQARQIDAKDGIAVLLGEAAKHPFEHGQIGVDAALVVMLGNGGIA